MHLLTVSRELFSVSLLASSETSPVDASHMQTIPLLPTNGALYPPFQENMITLFAFTVVIYIITTASLQKFYAC